FLNYTFSQYPIEIKDFILLWYVCSNIHTISSICSSFFLLAVFLPSPGVTPFREPSNFFYFFALSDTNKSGGLDTVEFKRMLYNKFKTAGKGKEEKIDSLMEEYFPSDEPDNVLYSFFKKVSGRNEVSITTYVQAFPQDLLQECTCSEYIHQCIASH
ncbi:uncharacterized protein LOC142350778, partial [Convolutriloba macropyga]|uniref:uncharacterized protein LOC142350778 n=1 Tax=Convolutriloba macropyga TaxID=536237 RepID=UPI003F51CA9F